MTTVTGAGRRAATQAAPRRRASAQGVAQGVAQGTGQGAAQATGGSQLGHDYAGQGAEDIKEDETLSSVYSEASVK